MAGKKLYDDIPGTIVFDSDQAARGYHLNQFCISLRLAPNREAFKADPHTYIDKFPMTAEQRDAALNQQWNRLLELGGVRVGVAELPVEPAAHEVRSAKLRTQLEGEVALAELHARSRGHHVTVRR